MLIFLGGLVWAQAAWGLMHSFCGGGGGLRSVAGYLGLAPVFGWGGPLLGGFDCFFGGGAGWALGYHSIEF